MLYLASDHAGFQLKTKIIEYLKRKGIDFNDLGTNSNERTDFPKYAKLLTDAVAQNKSNRGILICGTGIGMSIAANRNPKIRAGLCKNKKTAILARQHNNINVLVLAGRGTRFNSAKNMVDVFLTTEALGGVYAERMAAIDLKNIKD